MSAIPRSAWPQSADQIFDRLSTNKWVPIAVNLAAFALLAYGATQWFSRFNAAPAPISANIVQPQTPEQTGVDLEPLFSANLFGQPERQAEDINPEQLPISKLNLVLTGVMARGAIGFAFLSVNNAPEIFVTIGQEVTAGVTLEDIYPDRIVLRRGATLESVLLKDSDVVLPPGSIVGPGAEKILGTAGRPQPARSGPEISRDDVERGRTPEELEEAPPEPKVY
jgi:hypothetical protein